MLEDRIYCRRTVAFVDSVTGSCNRRKESHKSLTEKTLSNSRGQRCCPSLRLALHASICRLSARRRRRRQRRRASSDEPALSCPGIQSSCATLPASERFKIWQEINACPSDSMTRQRWTLSQQTIDSRRQRGQRRQRAPRRPDSLMPALASLSSSLASRRRFHCRVTPCHFRSKVYPTQTHERRSKDRGHRFCQSRRHLKKTSPFSIL